MAATDPRLQHETASLSSLRRHPRNYRVHPDDQLAHIRESLEANGQYRNIVVAEDGTILAGHGVVEAATQLGWEQVNVIRLAVSPDDPRAIKVLTGDNEIAGRAEVDDRMLADLLREVADVDDLLGTGYTAEMLANLVLVTRSEIGDNDAARHWAGLPDFEENDNAVRLVITCETEEERQEAMDKLGILARYVTKKGSHIAAWYPPREREDLVNVRYLGDGEEPDEDDPSEGEPVE